ncbi:MAG TPA: hypothetical protein VIU29_00145, partial [Candidatus Deferrimicrobiaceae bacterium]
MTSGGRPSASPIVLLVLFLLAGGVSFPVPASAQKSVDALCRIRGIETESDLGRIRKAYSDALRAGIPEVQLQPFVEDILLHKLDCTQVVRVLDVSTELRRKGLPYFVVFSKVREGMAKEAPPALVVEAAESKLNSLSESRDVLESLKTMGYRVRDFQNAAVVLSSYIEKGYTGPDIVTRIGNKGLQGAGFTAL